MKVKLTFTEELLGTSPSNPDVYAEFIAANAPDAKTRAEEIAEHGVDELVDKGMTVFPRTENGQPHIYDYQIKGFFKDACGMLARVKGDNALGIKPTMSSQIKAYKKVIDGLIFVHPRKIVLNLPEGSEIGSCQRPLRVQSPQGERVCLANSETVPAGTTIEFEIQLLDSGYEALVREWLAYGKLRGLGQWRNSGKGKYTWEEVKD